MSGDGLLGQVYEGIERPRIELVEPKTWPLTDLGLSERLVSEHGGDLRFVPGGGGWHAWDGVRWRRDTSGEVMRRAKMTVRAMEAEAAALEDDSARKRLLAFALRSEAEARLRAAISLAESDEDVIAEPDELDASPLLLNAENGVLHLESGDLLAHDRALLLTKLAPAEYDPSAEAPRWQAFLERIFAGDRDLIGFIQRAVGYSLTGLTREQVVFILYGSGANGKTTFVEAIRALLGDYAQQTPAETFLERRDTIPSDIARLRASRFVAAVETPEGRRLNETMVKRLVGGDTVTARFLRQEWFEFVPRFKAWIATNHRPVIRGTDEAIWRRIRLVPFTVTIPEKERDPELRVKLLGELPGILRWAVEGCGDYLRDGLGEAEPVKAATAAYRSDSDLVGSFIEELCVVRPDVKAKAGDLYAAFVAWCEQAGERERLTQKAFTQRLTERGFESKRDERARWRLGIGLAAEERA
jgi:putative DNA primase/helicase